MAEGDGKLYLAFAERVLNGEIDLSADSTGHTIRVALVTGHTPDQDAHQDWTDVSGNECSGTGYTAGGDALANQGVSIDSGTLTAAYDADDQTWTSLDLTGGQPNYAILYDDDHASDALIGYWEISTLTNGGNWGLTWNASGILGLTVT